MSQEIGQDPHQLRLSPSRINDFNNCPQLYSFRVIEKLPEPPSLDAERGKLVHSILEDLFEFSAADRTYENAVSLLPSRWLKQLESRPELRELVTHDQEWIDRASSLLANYFNLERPHTFEPSYRELHLEMNLTQDLYLHGYVDRLDIAPTGEVRIIDYKTGKSPKPGWEEKSLFQLRIYAFLYWRLHGVIPKLLQLIYLGDSKLIRSTPTENQLEKTERTLFDIADEIKYAVAKDEFRPKPSKLCDWCYFKSICPAHNN